MKEVKNVFFAINGDGAPSPDGFGGLFFQTYWDIVVKDVFNAVGQFFDNYGFSLTIIQM